MLLDREDARKLADLIGKKMAEDPGKWRAIARKVGPRAGCSSPFGAGSNLPAPGEAARALSFMHHAVHGMRPYPENGSWGSPDPKSHRGSRGPCGDDHDCNGESDYDAVKCGRGGEYYVCDCDSEAGYGGPGPCVSPEHFICGGGYRCQESGGPFKCTEEQRFDCTPPFECSGLFWQYDRGCATGDVFGCPHFTCEHVQHMPYGCSTFTCQSTYGCEGEKLCDITYGCPAEGKFNCPNSFICNVRFAPCDEDHFECEQQPGGDFGCTNYMP